MNLLRTFETCKLEQNPKKIKKIEKTNKTLKIPKNTLNLFVLISHITILSLKQYIYTFIRIRTIERDRIGRYDDVRFSKKNKKYICFVLFDTIKKFNKK